MVKTALIMAGGKGERFWPKSRVSLPKQFLKLGSSDKTMIQLTVERISPIVEPDNIFIVTNEHYCQLVRQQLPMIPEDNIICEPIGRNTAPCIGLGCVYITEKYKDKDTLMIVLPSDHLVQDNDAFITILNKACDSATDTDSFVTIGITPTYPETGYGYIKYSGEALEHGEYVVDSFVEKPDFPVAVQYFEDGHYLWNSGMFVFKTSEFKHALHDCMSDTYNKLSNIKESLHTKDEEKILHDVFYEIESQSIDYGIMEKVHNIRIIPGDFGWDDVGSWLSLERINKTDKDNNIFIGKVTDMDSDHITVDNESDHLIATLGLKDVIIVNTKDATLISSKDKISELKKLIAKLRENNMEEYL